MKTNYSYNLTLIFSLRLREPIIFSLRLETPIIYCLNAFFALLVHTPFYVYHSAYSPKNTNL